MKLPYVPDVAEYFDNLGLVTANCLGELQIVLNKTSIKKKESAYHQNNREGSVKKSDKKVEINGEDKEK